MVCSHDALSKAVFPDYESSSASLDQKNEGDPLRVEEYDYSCMFGAAVSEDTRGLNGTKLSNCIIKYLGF